MKKHHLILLGILLIFSSCYTVNKMNRQVTKGYIEYPIEFTETVTKLLPVKESDSVNTKIEYIKGDEIIDTIFIKADCDTVLPNKDGKKIVYLQGKNILRVDTFQKEIVNIKTVEDTRKITILNNEKSKLSEELAKKKNTIKIMSWVLSVLGIIIFGYLIIKKLIFK